MRTRTRKNNVLRTRGFSSGHWYNFLTTVQTPHHSPTWRTTRRIPSIRGSLHEVPPHYVEMSRWYPCASVLRLVDVSPKVDMQASEERTGKGGWYPVLDENGRSDSRRSPWCSVEITRSEISCVFENGDKLAPVISTLEALVVLIGLKTNQGYVTSTWMDNLGNGVSTDQADDDPFPSECRAQ